MQRTNQKSQLELELKTLNTWISQIWIKMILSSFIRYIIHPSKYIQSVASSLTSQKTYCYCYLPIPLMYISPYFPYINCIDEITSAQLYNLILIVEMGICLKLNKVITLMVIILAGLWFILVVILPQSLHNKSKYQISNILKDNWKVESIIHPIHFIGIDLHSLQLIEIVDHDIPNIFGEEAILVITHQSNQIDYSSLLSSLASLKLLGDRFRFPIYILKQKSNHNFYNYRTILHQGRTIQVLINKCIETHNIKRLTIISFQQSALISLLALSQSQSSLIFKIDKLIIINPFKSTHDLYQNDPKSLSRTIKRGILSDRRRLIAFHHLRILIINTFRTVHPQQPDSRDYFNFAFEDQNGIKFSLNSTLVLSSKSLYDINTYIEKGLYFHSKPFLNIILRVIIQDQKSKLQLKSIEYILRYRQYSQVQRSISFQNFRKCKIIFLQQLQRNIGEIKSNCIRIVQRQRYKYNQAVLIFYSIDKIQLYGDNYEKIPNSQYQTNKYYTNVITNLKDINEVIVVAGTKSIYFIMTIIRSPLHNPFQSITQEQENIFNHQEIVLIQSCQGWRPIIGLDHNQNFKELIQWKQGNCYIELEQNISYSQWFLYNWNIIRNIIIFSLFSSHVLGRYSYKRFYTSVFINLMLLLFFLRKIYLFQNMIITSTATLIQIVSLGLIKISQYVHISNHYYLILIMLPLFSQICKVGFGILTLSSLKMLWIQLVFVNYQTGHLISWIKFYFLIDTYYTGQPSMYSLILLATWQIINMPNSPFKSNSNLAQIKAKLTNILFLLMLCFSLGEQGSVIHQLVNFYMITHLLLTVGEVVNRLIENHQ